ncbi:hypothetical protein B5S28_g2506 [[Candida] boidinii]|nr:hypothetical protein B5S28_g2506 [[Candida] boidinii]OWB61408.1 hypothetical protein B5S29_g2297 [[Candida] boidinii]OWB72733.1 hypothetical protein B5S31_g2454 [[Candida] boidinii]
MSVKESESEKLDISSNSKTSTVTSQVEEGNKNAKKEKKQKKKGNKKSMNPADITPEYIEEMRKQREARKAAKKKELDSDDLSAKPQQQNDGLFIKRKVLYLNGKGTGQEDDKKSLRITIMTYNLLAQALIRRSLFPTNGDVLKWSRRSKMLLEELKYYMSDVLCFQEMDYIQYNTHWKKELANLGYLNKFYRSGEKNHGIAIFWKQTLFNCVDTCHIDYDRETTGDITPRTITRNVGLIVALAFTPAVLKRFPDCKKSGILIGTTHLFWHPFGTFERTRQTYIVLSKMKEFSKRVEILNKSDHKDSWFKFFAGDFNSQPYDSPYLSITKKPIKYDNRCKTVICCSTSYKYKSAGDEEDKEEVEQQNDTDEAGLESASNKATEQQPLDPVPKSFVPTTEQLELVTKMENLHNSLDSRAISLYSVGYKGLHPTNAGRDNDRNEPFFSNWAHTWRGLLDYIFLIKDWNCQDNCTDIESLEKFENENSVKINGLLRMPEPEEMGEEPSGQPRLSQYGSDHLCMICDLSLKMY